MTDNPGSTGGALSGIRVLDFTQVIFGPACTAILADHGAEVIKIERPGAGELARAFGPFLNGESMPYLALNRNKKGLAVNLKAPEGQELIYRLIPTADVVVSNFRAGVMESLGLGYDELSRLNPRLIYAVGSGYGQTGPYAERNKGGHESLAQAIGGAIRSNVGPSGIPTSRIGVAVCDISGGHILAEAILLALLARERTGVGQKVEVTLLDGVIWLQAWGATSCANVPGQGEGVGPGNPLDGGIYRTRDGYVVVTGLFRPNPLRDICGALGIEDLSLDARFSSVEAMSAHPEELRSLLQEPLLGKATAEWVDILEAVDILCAPVASLQDAVEDPQVLHNEMIVEIAHPRLGHYKAVGIPAKLEKTPGSLRTAPPKLGEHTAELMREAGYGEEEMEEMRGRKVVEWP